MDDFFREIPTEVVDFVDFMALRGAGGCACVARADGGEAGE